MLRRVRSTLLLPLAVTLVVSLASACGDPDDDSSPENDGSPTPTPAVNPYEVCVAHFENDVSDDPEVANLVLVVMAADYWRAPLGPQSVALDGFTGAVYADYHYEFGAGTQPPEYLASISTAAMAVVTGSSNLLGATTALEIEDDPVWYGVTGTSGTIDGGTGSIAGTLQPLADCPDCEQGAGSIALQVLGSSLTVGTGDPSGIAVVYCRDLPATFAGWRPGQPLPSGFREHVRGAAGGDLR